MNLTGIWRIFSRRKTEARQVLPGSILTAVFRRGEDGYVVAECPQLPGCMSQGKTKDEAVRNIRDAITSVLMVRLMSQFESEPGPSERDPEELAGEESFRVKGPELTSV